MEQIMTKERYSSLSLLCKIGIAAGVVMILAGIFLWIVWAKKTGFFVKPLNQSAVVSQLVPFGFKVLSGGVTI